MRRTIFILTAIVLSILSEGQVVFKTILPKHLIVAGESFSVQYVLDDAEKNNAFTPPLFKGFRIVSGPYAYKGSVPSGRGSSPVQNFVFTLVAPRAGKFFIPGATANVNGKLVKSDDLLIEVISKKDAYAKAGKREDNASEYFLQPGEDPGEKMKKNLFMKVLVNKTSCYVGEPVVATFKLYSRLESKSDIVKNPGFYGFAVQDIVSLNDNMASFETVNGKAFDVHTVRAVQLYPFQPGNFVIDPMEVVNKVEFSKSAVYKKTEQAINEGVYESNDPPAKDNTVTYENNVSTDKITIHVKPYPSAKRPSAFNGATGNFTVNASLEKNELAKNEEGSLIITISGKGNFTQLAAPVVQWPQEIERFDPVIKDSLDKQKVPLNGSRTFHFPFIAGKPGDYIIPPVNFIFFDPDSNNYKTISASIPGIRITNDEIKGEPKMEEKNRGTTGNNPGSAWLFAGIFCVVLIIISLQLRKSPIQQAAIETGAEKPETSISIDQLLQPVQFSVIADDGNFYTLLQKAIWDYLGERFQLTGANMNKQNLYKAMKERNFANRQHDNILDVLEECEAALFTNAQFTNDKQQLLNRAKAAMEALKA